MRAAKSALVGLAAAVVGCSLLVGGAPEPMACSEEGRSGPPACDPGFTCRSGVCTADPESAGAGRSGEGGERLTEGGQGGLPSGGEGGHR